IWRLPTVVEVFRSLTRHGTNAGGEWDEASHQATFRTRPDKESPLWNPQSQIVEAPEEPMSASLLRDIAALEQLSTAQLRSRYALVFGEQTQAHHQGWLKKRIAWRLQALALGELSERVRQRARKLANDADLRLNP